MYNTILRGDVERGGICYIRVYGLEEIRDLGGQLSHMSFAVVVHSRLC